MNIVESAIDCLAKKGFDQVSLEMIARETAVTRPLLKHYFEDLENLELTCLRYIRYIYQKLTVDALDSAPNEAEMLKAYLGASIDWTLKYRPHCLVWWDFLRACGKNKKYREINTIAVKTEFERVRALISQGNANGHFKVEDIDGAAKAIHLLVTGAIYSASAENIDDLEAFKRLIQDQCLRLANYGL